MSNTISSLNGNFTLPGDPELLNESILETIKTKENSILSIGLALVKVKTERLYKNLSFKNMTTYVLDLAKKAQKDRSSIFNWLYIGEIYLKYRKDLENAGFSSRDGVTKLPYLERALENNPKKEVYKKITALTQRDFADYARSIIIFIDDVDKNDGENKNIEENALEIPAENNENYLTEEIDDWGYIFYYKKMKAIRVNKKLGRNVLSMLIFFIKAAFETIEKKKRFGVVVYLENKREFDIFPDYAEKSREEMRLDMQQRRRKR